MKFMVTGANGQLGKEFAHQLERSDESFVALPRAELDITDRTQIGAALSTHRPDVLINTAAYTDVERAERDPQAALAVNAVAVENLLELCVEQNVLLVHFSTDYVFDGKKEGFYLEEDETNPLNAYGKSKLTGESVLRPQRDKVLVFRSSWVFGHGEQNFFFKLQQWSHGKDVMKVVYDQIATPTYTGDLVAFTLAAITKKLRGFYHLTNSGYASRYECARELFDIIDRPPLVLPVPSAEFPSPVDRPFFSALSLEKLTAALGSKPPSWQDALRRYYEREAAQP